ncbi:MAG: LysE family transporter [Acidobacteriota bacterium]|nr:LysE family transporter [Acidobacteriota bacterium]
MAAALGMSALLAASALAFSIVKYAGAAYLIFLGWKMIRDRAGTGLELHDIDARGSARATFIQGVWTEANTSADIVVALCAGSFGYRLMRNVGFHRLQRAASGAAMIGLGVYVAASESR